jgi:predicted nucleotidyltransferase
VEELYVFGSVARGEASPGSDVDLLVSFAAPPGFEGYWRVKEFLENLLGRPVDLVMKGALKPWAAPEVLREAVRVV